jgi:hypothetical protein
VPAQEPAASPDPIAERLAQTPHYDFTALLEWLAQRRADEPLDREEIRRSWARAASVDYGAPQDDATLGAASGWQRLADALAGSAAAGAGLGQFTGLAQSDALPRLDSFQGLSEGFRRL